MVEEYSAFMIGHESKEGFPPSVCETLEKEFEKDEIESREGFGSQVFHYPRAEAVVKRLNEAFGSCWSFKVKEHFKDDADPNTIVTLGVLVINHPKYPLKVIEQFAGKNIAKKRDGSVMNIANDYKSSASLALRKCAMLIGVGMYLQKGLPDEDLDTPTTQQYSSTETKEKKSAPTSSDSKYVSGGSNSGNKPASEKQINFAKVLYNKKGITEEVDFDNLNSDQVSAFIQQWKELPDKTSSSSATTTMPAPSSVKESDSPVETKENKVSVKPEDESENLKKLRSLASDLLGPDEDEYSPKVEKFILHIYKSNYSKELSSIHQISEEEVSKLIQTIEDDE